MKPLTALSVVLLVALLPGCERPPRDPPPDDTSTPAPAGLHDWTAQPIVDPTETDGRPLRILSTAPNVTEICAALGLAGQLIGRTRYCMYPPEVRRAPVIGDLYNLNVEVLLGLNADLVLVSGQSRAISDKLSQQGVRFETLPDSSLDDLYQSIARVGELTGRQKTATHVIDGIQAEVRLVTERFRSTPPQRVLVTIGALADPPNEAFVAGPGSFYDDLLRAASHTNIAADLGRSFSPLSLEFILRADPDVIIELVADTDQRPGDDEDAREVWRKLGRLQAVDQNRVHVLRGAEHYLLGPRIAWTYQALCEIIGDDDHVPDRE